MSENLFNISEELQDIILMLEEGEVTDELLAKLTITENSLKSKLESYIQVIRKYDDDIVSCKKEKDRVNRIQKTRSNTIERLKQSVLDAVLMFGKLSKSGNKVIEGSTYKLFSRNINSLVINELLVADIVKEFVTLVTECVKDTESNDLCLDDVATYISKYLTAAKIESKRSLNEAVDEEEITVTVSKDDLIAIPISISINMNLIDLNNPDNMELLKWLDANPHRASVAPSVSSTVLKSHVNNNADLNIVKTEIKTSLSIK